MDEQHDSIYDWAEEEFQASDKGERMKREIEVRGAVRKEDEVLMETGRDVAARVEDCPCVTDFAKVRLKDGYHEVIMNSGVAEYIVFRAKESKETSKERAEKVALRIQAGMMAYGRAMGKFVGNK